MSEDQSLHAVVNRIKWFAPSTCVLDKVGDFIASTNGKWRMYVIEAAAANKYRVLY
jgi:hypothetical protein